MGNEMGNQNSNGLQASEEDGPQATMGANDAQASMVSNVTQGQKAVADYAVDAKEQHDTKNVASDGSSTALFVSNAADGVEGMSQASPVGSENLPEKQSSHSNYSATNNNLVQKQTSKRREEEEMVTSLLDISSNYDFSAEVTRNQQINKAEDVLASDGQGNLPEGTKVERSSVTNPNTNFDNHTQYLQMTKSGSCGDKVLKDPGMVGETKEDNGEQGFPQSEMVGNDSTERENDASTDRISSSYLEAIDSEIEKLIIEEGHRTLKNGGSTTMSEATETDDIETETFEIKLEVFDINEKEIQKGDSGGTFEDSCLEQATDTGEWNEIKSRYGKQEDHSQRLACELGKENSEGKLERVEFGNCTSMESFNLDGICQDKIENLDNGKERLDNGKTFLVLSTSSLDSVGSASQCMQAKLEGLDATETDEEINTELISGKFSEWFKEAPSTSSEAHIFRNGSKQIEIPVSHQQPQGKEKKSIPMDHASSATGLKAFEGSRRFSTQSSQENPSVGTDGSSIAGSNLEQSVVPIKASARQAEKEEWEEQLPLHPKESVKQIIYKSEGGDEVQKNSASNPLEVRIEKSKQNPSLVSRTSIPTIESSHDEPDRSPLLKQKKSGESEHSALGASNSVKLGNPLVGLLKEEAYAVESLEAQEGLILKKTVEDARTPPAKNIMEMPLQGKGKQKPRYSLFGNCMCCKTAIN